MGINAIVGQSGGPTCVINSSLAGVFSACRKHGVQHVYGMRHGVQGLLKDDVVNLTDMLSAPGQLTLLRHTPASYLGSCRYKLPESDQIEAVYQEIFDVLRRYDLTHTDHTPGYGSAAKYIGTTIKELVRDSTIYDLKSVTIVEIMGRNAGWLTAAAALAEDEDCEGAAMICLPEIPFDPDHFIARVDAIQQQTPSLVVAVSEGVRIADGRYVCELAHNLVNVDAFGHTYLSGTAHYLSSLVAAKLHSKTRAVELSTLQRCAAHVASETDVSEAFGVGAFAVDAAFSGKTGMMAALKRVSDAPYTCGFELHDIHDIANLEKKIPLDWIDAEHYRLREPFFAYARPLIAEEVKPEYQKGLPRHLKLKR
jgi:6-phosphofructokinase 1